MPPLDILIMIGFSSSLLTTAVQFLFAFEFVVSDFTLLSQLISDNKSQKAKNLHSRGTQERS